MEGSMTTAEPSIFRWLSPKQSPATPVPPDTTGLSDV